MLIDKQEILLRLELNERDSKSNNLNKIHMLNLNSKSGETELSLKETKKKVTVTFKQVLKSNYYR